MSPSTILFVETGFSLQSIRNLRFKSTLLQESIFLKVETSGAKYILAAVHLPPNSSTFDYMRFLSEYPHHTLLLGGDFNLSTVIWDNDPLNFKISVYIRRPALFPDVIHNVILF